MLDIFHKVLFWESLVSHEEEIEELTMTHDCKLAFDKEDREGEKTLDNTNKTIHGY